MKSDIYYLSNKISSIETNSHTLESEEHKNEIAIKQIQENLQKINATLHQTIKRIENLEANQEHIAEQCDDIDSKVRKNENDVSKITTQQVFTNEEKEAFKNKLNEVEETLNNQISSVYDNVFNEILNLKHEVKTLKNKTK
jgi:chromosome segregation ATPase